MSARLRDEVDTDTWSLLISDILPPGKLSQLTEGPPSYRKESQGDLLNEGIHQGILGGELRGSDKSKKVWKTLQQLVGECTGRRFLGGFAPPGLLRDMHGNFTLRVPVVIKQENSRDVRECSVIFMLQVHRTSQVAHNEERRVRRTIIVSTSAAAAVSKTYGAALGTRFASRVCTNCLEPIFLSPL